MGQQNSQMGQGAMAALRLQHSHDHDHDEERRPLVTPSRRNGEPRPVVFAGHQDQDPELEIDHDGCFPPHGVQEPCPANPCRDLPVFDTIHRIRREVIEAIGTYHL